MLGELARVTHVGQRVVLAELGRWSAWAFLRRIRARFHDFSVWDSALFWSRRKLRRLLETPELEPGTVSAPVFHPPSPSLARLLTPS